MVENGLEARIIRGNTPILKPKFETILFPQDIIQDIHKLHWNIIHKSAIVTWNVGPYKLIKLPGYPNLNLNLINYNKYKIIAITILITLRYYYYNSFTYQEHIQLTITFMILTTKQIIGDFTEKYPNQKQFSKNILVTLEKPQLLDVRKKT